MDLLLRTLTDCFERLNSSFFCIASSVLRSFCLHHYKHARSLSTETALHCSGIWTCQQFLRGRVTLISLVPFAPISLFRLSSASSGSLTDIRLASPLPRATMAATKLGSNPVIGFIGAGNMAQALARGLIQASSQSPRSFSLLLLRAVPFFIPSLSLRMTVSLSLLLVSPCDCTPLIFFCLARILAFPHFWRVCVFGLQSYVVSDVSFFSQWASSAFLPSHFRLFIAIFPVVMIF